MNISDGLCKEVSRPGDSGFPCFCCGYCCSDFQPHLDLPESQKLAENLGLSLQQFYEECTDPRWPGVDTHLIKHIDGKCLFLECKDGQSKWLCRIHDFKPDACLQWAAGPEKKQCQKGLNHFWGLTLDAEGNLIGSLEHIDSFKKFLKTLD